MVSDPTPLSPLKSKDPVVPMEIFANWIAGNRALENAQVMTASSTIFAAGTVTTEPETVAEKLLGLPEDAEFESVHVALAGTMLHPLGPVSVIVVAVFTAFRKIDDPVVAAPDVVILVAVVPVPEFDTVKSNVFGPEPPVEDLRTARAGCFLKDRSSIAITWFAGLVGVPETEPE